jgi:adenylate cyclase
MRDLDFRAAPVDARYADVHEAIDSLERAKTVVRALGKYVPIDLVRRLFAQNADPTLGGELRDLSILFSDIEGFTTLSEKLEPDALAEALGRYLQAMTDAIEKERGVIDKYVGDAVMALWNAPTEVEDHAAAACRAALACIEATSALFASEAWKGLPKLHTRFGIHRANVMVGHFGAPTRFSYTAIGDGVNLAARLEGQCKQYGVTVLVSQAVVDSVGDRFAFRKLDVVAVKGKKKGVEVYELLGTRDRAIVAGEVVRDYEEALGAYMRRAFDEATSILARHPDDAPSCALAERCAVLKSSPPPADWDGVWVARSK